MTTAEQKNNSPIKNIAEAALVRVGYFLVRCLYATCKINQVNLDNRESAKVEHPKGSYLLACWHEHVVMIILSQKGEPFHPIVSKSGSGRFVGYVCKKFGYTPIHGSADRDGKNKGGTAALFGLLRSLKKGAPVAITVDGSIGPRRWVKPGIVDLARKTGARILPAGCSCSNYWELNTWDKLKIPKPFSTFNVYYGAPIEIEKTLPAENILNAQELVADAINQAEQLAIKELR